MAEELEKICEDAEDVTENNYNYLDEVAHVATDVTPQINKDRGSAVKSEVRGSYNTVTISVTINHTPR